MSCEYSRHKNLDACHINKTLNMIHCFGNSSKPEDNNRLIDNVVIPG